MTVYDGTDTFSGDKGVSSARLNKTVLWHGDTLPTAGNNEVPTNGLFLKTNTGIVYENTGTLGSPTWTIRIAQVLTDTNPTGTILMHGRNSTPTGYLFCNGAAVSRTTYATLFAAISTSFGVGDGSTTFNLPNLISKFPRGSTTSNNAGSQGGSDTTSVVTVAELVDWLMGTYTTAEVSSWDGVVADLAGSQNDFRAQNPNPGAGRKPDLKHRGGSQGFNKWEATADLKTQGQTVNGVSIIPTYVTITYVIKYT